MRAQMSVLLIEDDPASMELAQFLLEEAGWAVRRADCADEARRCLAEGVPQLVLLDIHLPGCSGLDLVAELRRMRGMERVPVIALTAHAMRGDRERFLRAGFTGYLSKPIEVATFIDRLNGWMRGEGGTET